MGTCLVIENNGLSRTLIIQAIEKFKLYEKVIGVESAEEGGNILRKEKINGLFLDIRLPGMSGFDLLETLPKEHLPPTVICSKYLQNAIAGYDYLIDKVVYFLEKPVTPGKLGKAISKLYSLRNPASKERFLKVKTSENLIVLVALDEIHRFEASNGEVLVLTAKGTFWYTSSLRSLVSKLPPNLFCRIHGSHIISANWIDQVNPVENILTMKSKDFIPIGKQFRKKFFSWLSNL